MAMGSPLFKFDYLFQSVPSQFIATSLCGRRRCLRRRPFNALVAAAVVVVVVADAVPATTS